MVVHDWGGAIGSAGPCQCASNTPASHSEYRSISESKHMKLPFTLWLIRNTPRKAARPRRECLCRWGDANGGEEGDACRIEDAYIAPYNNWSNRVATFEFVKNIPLLSSDEGYDTLVRIGDGLNQFSETPTLLCWGGQDFVFDDAFLEEWQKRMPHAELMYHPDAGHYILEDEKASVCDRIQSFLS